MIKFKRKIIAECESTEAYPLVSASYNSSKQICLRSRDYNSDNEDEIIILTAQETQAIVDLFKAMKHIDQNDLPF